MTEPARRGEQLMTGLAQQMRQEPWRRRRELRQWRCLTGLRAHCLVALVGHCLVELAVRCWEQEQHLTEVEEVANLGEQRRWLAVEVEEY